jgi:hypothetical protein
MAITPIYHPATGGIKTSAREFLYPQKDNWFWLSGVRTNRNGFGLSSRSPQSSASAGSFSVVDFSNNTLSGLSMGVSSACVRNLATDPYLPYIINKTFWRRTGGGFTQLTGYVQVTQPSGTGITKRVLLVADAYNFTTAFAARGDTFEVEIDGTATFRWRVNAGAWTSLVPIATSVTVGTYYTLYFLTTTGYTATDNWVWRRTDTFLEASGTAAPPPGRIVRAGNDYIFVGYGNLIGRSYFGRSGSTNGEFVARSVGYKRAYGQHLMVYQDHLFIAGFTETASELPTKKLTMSWSDLSDLDNFFATDVNEADTYTITGLSPNALVEEQITGFAVWNNALYTFTQTSIHRTIYVGLPNVMYTEKVTDQLGCISDGGVVTTAKGIYFPGQDAVYRFDGSSFTNVSQDIQNAYQSATAAGPLLFPAVFDRAAYGGVGSYDPYCGEIRWSLQAGPETYCWIVLNENTGLWSTETVPDSSVVTSRHQTFPITTNGQEAVYTTGTDSIYEGNRSIYPGSTPNQILITNIFQYSNDVGRVLELQDLWVDVRLTTSAVLTGFYQVGDKLSDFDLLSSASSWVSMGTFNTTTNRFPNVRVKFKYIAYKFVITRPTGSAQIGVFNGFIDYIYGLPDPAAK